jgi:hypothetical protein
MRKLISLSVATALAAAALAPAPALAHDRRGYHDHGYERDYYDRRHYRDRDDNDDELAAGAIGFVFGLALGAAANMSRERERNTGYYQRGYSDYPPAHRGAYERDYGYGYQSYPPPRPQCTRSERQRDRYANRYVTVDVPC